MRTTPLIALLLVVPVLAATAGGLSGTQTYAASGTAVVRTDGLGTVVDSGAMVCNPTLGVGAGGGCVPWASLGNGEVYLEVVDDNLGADVAYQVCIDNDGDGSCAADCVIFTATSSPCVGCQDVDGDTVCDLPGITESNPCPDIQVFSHHDDGSFFNPLGPLPTAFLNDCDGGFEGWVVFTCTGVHSIGGAHTHEAISGELTPATSGGGYGTFCFSPLPEPKAYVVA